MSNRFIMAKSLEKQLSIILITTTFLYISINQSMNLLHTLPEKYTQIQCFAQNLGLQSSFLEYIQSAFKYRPKIFQLLEDEIQALVAYADYCLSIARDQPQPYDSYYCIVFVKQPRTIKLLWLCLSVVVPYLSKKLIRFCSNKEGPIWKKVLRILNMVKKVVAILQFVNYAIFLMAGEYRCLIQRILGIKMQLMDQENKRVLEFELLNRSLMWTIYQEFIRTVLPGAVQFVRGPLYNLFALDSYLQMQTSQESEGCVFCCSETPIMPVQLHPCNHLACYYCCKIQKTDICGLCGSKIEGNELLGSQESQT